MSEAHLAATGKQHDHNPPPSPVKALEADLVQMLIESKKRHDNERYEFLKLSIERICSKMDEGEYGAP